MILQDNMAGIMKKQYHLQRKKRFDLRYRMNRRAQEAMRIIDRAFQKKKLNSLSILDIGTADGMMLSKLNRRYRFKKAVGIDMSKELLSTNKDKGIRLMLGNAENLKFASGSFDIITACAVIEHVDSPKKMLLECRRVLKKGGILIITTPNPFHDEIATRIGYLKDEEHLETLTLRKLGLMFNKAGFLVLVRKHFMIFPFFSLPFEQGIESFFRAIGLGRLMSNQLVAARKR